MKISTKASRTIVAAIIIISLCVSFFYVAVKQGYHEDELLAFNLANSSKQLSTDGGWNTPEDFSEYLTAGEHRFDYSNAYQNQIIDASHPPFWYFLVHTVCSFFPGVFSKYLIFGINIVMMVCSLILLYLIGKRVTGNNLYALIALGGYALSIACITTTIYLRMYATLVFFALAFLYITLVIYDRKKIKPTDYIFMFLIVFFGVLTQYYFLVFAGLCGFVYFIFCIKDKKIRPLIIYILTAAAAFGCAFAFYPYIIENLFGGNRGLGSLSINIDTITIITYVGYKLMTYFEILAKELFSGQLWLLIICALGMVGFFVYFRFVKKIKLPRKAFFIMVPGIITFGAIALVSPFNSDRYVMTSLPMLSMMTIFAVIKIFTYFSKNRGELASVCAVALLSVLGLIFIRPYYIYGKTNLYQPKTKDCLFVGTEIKEWNKCIDKFMQYDETMIVQTSKLSPTLTTELEDFANSRGVITNGKIKGFVDGYMTSGMLEYNAHDSLENIKGDEKLNSLSEITVYISRIADQKAVSDYIKQNTGLKNSELIQADCDFNDFYNWYDYFVNTESYCNVYRFYK